MVTTPIDTPIQDSNNLLDSVLYSAGTDVGMRRDENQDSYGILIGEGYRLFIVADGMGGVQGGSIASNLAIAAIERELRDRANLKIQDVINALQEANRQVHARSEQDSSLSGMGTTIASLFITKQGAFTIHVGDSRVYQIKKDRIIKLTEDHTLVQELVRSGAISETQAEHHPVAHMLTRSIGPSEKVEPTVTSLKDGLSQKDKFLICSDGLYNMVKDHEIFEIITTHDTDTATQHLIDLANERGGSDNITVILIDIKNFFIPKEEIKREDEKSTSISAVGYHETNDLSYQSEPKALNPLLDNKKVNISNPLLFTGLVPRTGLILGGFFSGLVFSYLLFSHFASNNSESKKLPTVSTVTEISIDKSTASDIDINSSNNLKSIESKIGTTDKSSIQKRKQDLEDTVKDIDGKLLLLQSSPKSDLEALEKQAQKRADELKIKIEQLRADIDVSTRKLATWYDRKRRLDTTDIVNMASELAPTIPSVKSKKDEFEKATWDYLRQVESLRYVQSDSSEESKVSLLIKIRSDRMKELSNEVHTTVDKSLAEADDVVAMLTLQRSSLEKELEEVKQDLDFARIAIGAEPDKKDGIIATLQQRKASSEEELSELIKLLAN